MLRALGCLVAMLLLGALSAAQAQGPSALSPDKRLSAAGNGRAVEITDVASQRVLMRVLAHGNDVTAVAFAPDGKLLFSGDRAGVVCTIDLATGKLVWKFAGGQPVRGLRPSNDGRKVQVERAAGGNLELDARTGKQL